MKIELEMTDNDFNRLTETSAAWRSYYDHAGDGWAIQLASGRFENMEKTDDPPFTATAGSHWEYVYWLSDRWSDVILARSFLKANGEESELLWDMRDAPACCYLLLTNYKSESWRRVEARAADDKQS